MDTLITCPCGHTLASHDTEGCFGERLRPCHCRRDRVAALDAAVNVVRSPQHAASLTLLLRPPAQAIRLEPERTLDRALSRGVT